MSHLVLTVVGDDRAGLVNALADTVSSHGGNWERSELAELAGAFAGIVLVSVPDDRADELTAALEGMAGLLRVTTHLSSHAAAPASAQELAVTVTGNDHPGIVRDVTAAIAANSLSIESFHSRTLDAPMSGGTLFEATAEVRISSETDAAALTAALERLAGEIQVDITID